MSNKIRVLIIDDSAVVRQTLSHILSSAPDIEVVATAPDPIIAIEKIQMKKPDVMILDIEMPRMDGLTFLQKIMSQHPIPTVICSCLTEKGSDTALKALQYGAVEIIHKPKLGTKKALEESEARIVTAVKAASIAKVKTLPKDMGIGQRLSADAIIPSPSYNSIIKTTDKVVAVGASTGGTEAIRVFLESMPYDAPGIIIVQHMPEQFTRAFAQRLDSMCRVTVKEAQNRDSVIPGKALIAPGNHHMLLKRSGARYFVEIVDGPLVNHHRPSVDVLFRSAARYAGKNSVGIIMTGMGGDGALGMLEMKQAGAYTIAQNEETCVIFGMPNEAIKKGGVEKTLPLEQIAREVMRICS